MVIWKNEIFKFFANEIRERKVLQFNAIGSEFQKCGPKWGERYWRQRTLLSWYKLPASRSCS